MSIENKEFNEGVEVKEVSALDAIPKLLQKRNLLLKAKDVSTDNYITFGGKLGDTETEMRVLLPAAIEELSRKIEDMRKFGDVQELEQQKSTYEKILLDIAPPRREAIEVADYDDNLRALGKQGEVSRAERMRDTR